MKLHEILESSAKKNPEAIAIVHGECRLSYQALNLFSSRLAAKLKQWGVGLGDRVALWAEKSPWVVVSMHAILKLGAAYVPLDPLCPVERARRIIHDCEVRALITTKDRASFTTLPSLFVDDIEDIVKDFFEPLPVLDFSENSLAYILYTSGSTGTPKGVCMSHKNAMAFIEWAANLLNIEPEDRFSNHAPFHFDLSVLDLYVPLLKGASVCLIPELLGFVPKKLVAFLHHHQITHWYSVPSALMLMMEGGGLCDQPLPSLKSILFAGEVFPAKHLKKLRAFFPHAKIFNLYGPTETNVCTFYEVNDVLEPLPIGKLCCGNEAWIVDEHDEIIAVSNQAGELVVRGPTVMLGYWGSPPVADSTYRTGDRVLLSEDGNFIFLGRKDHQVKIRGYRVSLLEIEMILLEHPNIVEAAVFVLGEELEARLWACVLVRDSAVTALDIKSHAARYLPPSMNIAGLEVFSDFPRTSTGKVDRSELFLQLQKRVVHANR